MNATKFIAAAAVFVAAGSAFAADAPATAVAAAATTLAAASVDTTIAASALNIPTVSISKVGGRNRADVHAEAVEFVKNYKTTFAVQLEQYKN